MGTKVYILGNEDSDLDNKPFLFLKDLRTDFPNIHFQIINPNQDIPSDETLLLIDTISGINDLAILTEDIIDKLSVSANTSVHDFDLGFQLKYLKKLGKLKQVKILGIPMNKEVSYDSFHSSFKKFVAQDIQGS